MRELDVLRVGELLLFLSQIAWYMVVAPASPNAVELGTSRHLPVNG